MTDQTPIPAATLVLFRDRADGPPELLMVERAETMAFAGGALVFPGGRIDPGDDALALEMGQAGAAPRIAAIRETLEEVGLPVGLVPVPDAGTLRTVRAALHARTAFGKVLDDAGLALDLSILVPFARWLPAYNPTRIFDTMFYLARLPADAPPPRVDATENTRLLWATARNVLDDADSGRARIIFPTRCNLERLACFADFDAACADAAAHPIRTITPWLESRGGVDHICIPDGLGYPVTSQPLTAATRG